MATEGDQLQIISSIPDGCIPLRSIEIVQFLNPEGEETALVHWQGPANIVAELGMIEYAKFIIASERNADSNREAS